MKSRFRVFLDVYRSWKFLSFSIAVGLAYYFLFQYLLVLSSKGLVLDTAPPILVYSLDLSASVVITLAAYYANQRLSVRRIARGASSGLVGTASVIVAGVTAGCACQAPVLYGLLYFLGLNALEASGFVAVVNEYQVEILLALVAINLVLIFVTLGRIRASSTAPQTKKP